MTFGVSPRRLECFGVNGRGWRLVQLHHYLHDVFHAWRSIGSCDIGARVRSIRLRRQSESRDSENRYARKKRRNGCDETRLDFICLRSPINGEVFANWARETAYQDKSVKHFFGFRHPAKVTRLLLCLFWIRGRVRPDLSKTSQTHDPIQTNRRPTLG